MAREYMANRPNKVPVPNNLKIKTADGEREINYLTKSNDPNENSISQSQQELMDKVENKEGFKMVGSKGHSFPMVEKDPVEMQKEKIMKEQGLTTDPNRAGSAVGRNMLVNNPNNPQPMNKVPASTVGREQMFNEMAMNKGERFEQPGATTTPQAPMFPNQQGSFASYANPKKVSEDLEIDNPLGGLKDMMENLKEKRSAKKQEKNTKVGTPVTPEKPEDPAMYDGLNFNAKLRAASESGALDDSPEFKEKVDAAPSMNYGKAPAKFSMSKPAEKIDYIQSSSVSPLSMKNRFDHAHTKVTKRNVNASMKDDAAHISYLKRDINYDNKHGGSNKQMTADEKHISKLAGDIKYDVKKKRKYDNV